MKKEEINIRIEAEIKNKFKQICDNENTTMSNKIQRFINEEIYHNIKNIKTKLIKTIVEPIILNNLFETIDVMKLNIETELNENLSFNTNISKLENLKGFTFLQITYQSDNDGIVVLDITIKNSY
jgi:antitoxin component of RelBE/YafQ-DinJ toxin-antitoxin module